MSDIGQIERETQNRLINLFQNELGYSYLGNWEKREGNRNVEEDILKNWLVNKKKLSTDLVDRAISEVNKVSDAKGNSLYDINKKFYSLLRYGVNVQLAIGQNRQIVWLIDWDNPENNDFAIAEKVTIDSSHYKKDRISFCILME